MLFRSGVGDLWALERASILRGLYHVLGGTLSALNGIGPEDLNIALFAKGFADAGKINDIVTTLKKEGFVAATHKKWFGTTPPDSSSSVKVMDVPKL